MHFRHLEGINKDSLANVIDIIIDLIKKEPPELTDLDLCGLGGSLEQCQELLRAIYDSRMQIRRLDISENPTWAQFEEYSTLLSEFFSDQQELEDLNLSHNQKQVSKVWPIIESLRESPSFSKLKSVHLDGVAWTEQEATDVLFPFIRDAKNLEKFVIPRSTLFKPELILTVIQAEENERIIEVLYVHGELILDEIPPWWKPGTPNFDKLLEFISKLKKLKKVEISDRVLEGERIQPIIASLESSHETIEEIKFQGVDWSIDSVKEQLVRLVAGCKELKKCDIMHQKGEEPIELSLEKQAESGKNQYCVKAMHFNSDQVYFQADVVRTGNLTICNITEEDRNKFLAKQFAQWKLNERL